MSDRTTTRRWFPAVLFAAIFLFAGTRSAQAQGFISPFIGYNFSGDSGCPAILNCQDKRTDWGVALGAVGSIVGFEAEFGYTKNFFGETSSQTSNVLTFMGNFMLAPKIGPVQPYGLAGIGLIRTSVETVGGTTSSDQNQIRMGPRWRPDDFLRPARRHPRRHPLLPLVPGARLPQPAGHGPWSRAGKSSTTVAPRRRSSSSSSVSGRKARPIEDGVARACGGVARPFQGRAGGANVTAPITLRTSNAVTSLRPFR